MAIKTRLQAHGFVQNVTRRSGTSTKDGVSTPWEMVTVLIIGDGTMCEATVGKGLSSPSEGEEVHALVEVDVYRQEDSVTITRWLDGPETKKGGN